MIGNPTSLTLELAKKELQRKAQFVRVNEPLSKYTTFRIGGPSDIFCVVRTSEQLIDSVKIAREYELPVFILGGGSNILVSDRGIRGVTIKNESQAIDINGEILSVDTGIFMPKLAKLASEKGLSGCEFMQAIPGTLGGGVHQNARFRHPDSFGDYEGFQGTRDIHIGHLTRSVTVLLPNNNLEELTNDQCGFVYEGFYCSGFHDKSVVIVNARLQLQADEPDIIRKRLRMYSSYRSRRSAVGQNQEIVQPIDPFTKSRPGQPLGASAGCVFYNVPNAWDHPTGRMIDMCGLKGMRVGDAQISDKHANYIVNLGNARADDVCALIEQAKKAVWERFQVELRTEIDLVGDW